MRKRWANKSGKFSSEVEPIEVESGDEVLVSLPRDRESADGQSRGGSLVGSHSGASWSVLEPGKSVPDDLQSNGLGSDNFGFDFLSPEGKDEFGTVEPKKCKTVVEVVDEATDVPLPVEQAVSANAATRRVSDLALRSTNLQQFKFPWEKGRLGRVFGNNELVSIRSPVLEPTGYNPVSLNLNVSDHVKMTPAIKVREVAKGGAVFSAVVRKIPELNYIDERKQKRARALKLWWDLLSTVPTASEVGRKAMAEAPEDPNVHFEGLNL